MKILITGAAGFIGFHAAQALIARGGEVVGLDNVNDYYDPRLKEARITLLAKSAAFRFERLDIANSASMKQLFEEVRPDRVLRLAAQAGVRYGMTNPSAYAEANLVGFLNVLEGCRAVGVQHLVFASSSSVYGANRTIPFSVRHSVDHPVSLYAATKKANELMAHAYAHLYQLPVTGLRFFTVYGPWGRPDMAIYRFTEAIFRGETIDIYNNGHHSRDFTYIDDIVDGVLKTLDLLPVPDPDWQADQPRPDSSTAPYRVYNIGNKQPVPLMHLIECLERAAGRTVQKRFLPMQPGDVIDTFADIDSLTRSTGFLPRTPIEKGIDRFIEWYRDYHRLHG